MKSKQDFSRLLWQVGMQLYRAREEAGLSRHGLQLKTDIHKNTIARYENGEASPTLTLIAVMADALGYEVKVELVKKEAEE